MPSSVPPNSDISRFILQKSHFSKENGRVKYSAWLPNQNGETSVFITTGLEEDEIWIIGESHVAAPQGKTLYARGVTLSSVVTESGLSLNFDNEPPRHANIEGWPAEKSEQKMLAIELAEASSLHTRE